MSDGVRHVGQEIDGPATAELHGPVLRYFAGHASGETAHFRAAFLPSAHIEGVRDGSFVSWTLEDYCANPAFGNGPAPDEAERVRTIDVVDVVGTVATVRATLQHGGTRFTDMFLLVHTDDGWRIANKVYDIENVIDVGADR